MKKRSGTKDGAKKPTEPVFFTDRDLGKRFPKCSATLGSRVVSYHDPFGEAAGPEPHTARPSPSQPWSRNRRPRRSGRSRRTTSHSETSSIDDEQAQQESSGLLVVPSLDPMRTCGTPSTTVGAVSRLSRPPTSSDGRRFRSCNHVGGSGGLSAPDSAVRCLHTALAIWLTNGPLHTISSNRGVLLDGSDPRRRPTTIRTVEA